MTRDVGKSWQQVAAVLIVASSFGGSAAAVAEGDFARLVVERKQVYAGRSLTVSVVVKSQTLPREPVFPPVAGLRVGPLVGGTYVRDAKAGTRTFQYQVLARQVGTHRLGPVTVALDGREIATAAEDVTVLAPEKTGDAELLMTLSKSACVVGEPVTLTVQWRIAMPLETVKAVDFRLPVLQAEHLDVLDPHPADRSELVSAVGLPVSNTRILARYGTGMLGERKCATLTFSKVLVPRRAGRIAISEATVLCTVAPPRGGGNWRQYPSYFDNDFFKRDTTGRGRVVFVTAAGAALDVSPLPVAGRPMNFSHLVGPYELSISATPPTVSVGAPVTLTIRVTGASLENVDLPPLRRQAALARDFTIADRRSPGRIEGGSKVFVRTVRPVGPHVRQAPSMELTWYDPRTGRYGVSRSAPIPLTVTGSRAVGASDVEGGAAAAVAQEIEAERAQLTHSFGVDEVLAEAGGGASAVGGAVWWGALLAVPPGALAALAASCLVRRRRRSAAAEGVRARGALAGLRERIAEIRDGAASGDAGRSADIEAALREYLGGRLGMATASLTYGDVAGLLRSRDVPESVLAALDMLFEACQARRFAAGSADADGWELLAEQAEAVVTKIEEALA